MQDLVNDLKEQLKDVQEACLATLRLCLDDILEEHDAKEITWGQGYFFRDGDPLIFQVDSYFELLKKDRLTRIEVNLLGGEFDLLGDSKTCQAFLNMPHFLFKNAFPIENLLVHGYTSMSITYDGDFKVSYTNR
jgi:hypothetical protein